MGFLRSNTNAKLVDGKHRNVGYAAATIAEKKATCTSDAASLPPLPWPQAPLMMRASSATTRVLGIRHIATNSNARVAQYSASAPFLPLNNGDEADPLAVDFESDLFRGTLMVRVKGATNNINEEEQAERNYFTGKHRQFQVLIRGKFLQPDIAISDLLSGQILEHPLGKLPGMPIVSGILKLYKTLQPKLNVELGNAQAPYAKALSPLAALAQTVVVHKDDNGADLPIELEEPHPSDPTSLFPDASLAETHSSLFQRRHRRKHLVQRDTCFDTDKTYTFDMYQHQLHLTDYTLQFAMYRLSIAPVLNGQPLRILATVGDRIVWSFELWHEKLLSR